MERFGRACAGVLFAGVLVAGSGSAVGAPESAREQAVIRLPLSRIPVSVDGTIGGPEYADAVVLGGSFSYLYRPVGGPIPNSPVVYVKRTADRIHIAYDNPLGEGERPIMTGALPDNGGICADHAVELYFMPAKKPGDLTSFIQFGGNARGAVYDTLRTPQIGISDVAGFTIPWLFRNRLTPGRWESEVSATFAQLGIGRTADGDAFDAGFERDGGRGAWGYQPAFSAIVNGRGVKVIFDSTAPVVKWLSFGEFEKNRFNPRLQLVSSGRAGVYTVSLEVTAARIDPDTQTYPVLFTRSERISLAAGGEKEFSASFDLAPKSAGIARYRIEDAAGTVVFFRKLPFATSNERLVYPAYTAEPLAVKAEMAPSFGRLLVSADVIDLPGDKSRVRVDVTARRDGGPAVAGTISSFPYDYGQAILRMSDGPLPAGTYTVACRAVNTADGRPIGPERTATVVRKVYEWENNTIGITDKAFHPWTPVEVRGGVAACWGREYRFTGLGLPASIMTLQPEPSRGPAVRDALAGPVRLAAESKGRRLPWTPGTATVRRVNETRADVSGGAEAPGLKVVTQSSLELDGFLAVRLTVTPTAPTELDSLRVEVPLPSAAARLFNHSAENMRENKTFADFEGMGDGVLWDSKTAAHNALISGNFVPTAWIGDEDRGIAWMCDNDRSWVTTFDKPCLDVVRKGRETVFRMHLVNTPARLVRPIEVVFGLQATPVRPRPAGGSWRSERDYGWSYFDAPLVWTDCFDESKSRRPEDHPRYIDEQAKRDGKWWRYLCFNSDRIPFDDPTYGSIVRDFAAEWYIDAPLAFVQSKSHIDFILWAYKEWHDRKGLTGSYHDNTYAVAWPGLINDTGWIDAQGRKRAGYWVMANREFAKRERAYWLSVTEPPVMKAHVTDAPIAGYLGFCDFWLDGENGGYPDPAVQNPDFVDRWYNRKGMANLRITLGRQWGVMPQYLYNWGKDATEALLGLFEVRGATVMGDAPRYDFGLKETDCLYMPYWDVKRPVRVVSGGPDVLCGVWKRPGRVRILVSNLSNGNRSVTLALNAAVLGLPKNAVATDEQSFEAVPLAGGALRNLAVNRHNYRVILLAAPGTFPPLDPALGRALEPANRIPALCDDFGTLKPEWETIRSPLVESVAGPQREIVSSHAGHLRIMTSSWTYSAVHRPFNEDNCSVQIKIRRMSGFAGPGFGPMLCLYWNKDTWVRMLSGTDNLGQKTRCEGTVGGKRFEKNGPAPALLTWVKITLRRDAIEFHASADGTAWTLVDRRPRTGFEGAPARLFIGHGAPGANEMMRNESHQERYTFYSWFDDLVTARVK